MSIDRLVEITTSSKERKVQIVPTTLDLGNAEMNVSIQDISCVNLDMFLLPMFILHNSQQEIVE